jgi:hypothetical protein
MINNRHLKPALLKTLQNGRMTKTPYKYCCEKFEESHRRNRQSSPNIRIVKFVSEELIDRSPVSRLAKGIEFYYEDTRNSPFRFYISIGYEKFRPDIPAFNIDFCPFCGTNLYTFYKSDEYANETEGTTFPLIFQTKQSNH